MKPNIMTDQELITTAFGPQAANMCLRDVATAMGYQTHREAVHDRVSDQINDNRGQYHTNEKWQAIPEIISRILQLQAQEMPVFEKPETAKELFISYFAGEKRENFACAWLDTRHRLIRVETLFIGTINSCEPKFREILASGLRVNAAAVIASHNHPSGLADPSSADISLTKKLKSLLAEIDIRLLDHIVVGDNTAQSIAEMGGI
ncbi:hypothetical protein B1757_12845 [Acidithiobacillus marinus]|uniref:MPN domain-containing protein n=1 Tax=Acidithiobacillus marinus TaxID=187490 RepID=A0A2I1DIY4_9PROT|nr:JAB domain-containing protein [Acidithiobacillus marinus]PKY09831.1 hypothetical protein B1757_12845 [Acidithiobacillus marinus]